MQEIDDEEAPGEARRSSRNHVPSLKRRNLEEATASAAEKRARIEEQKRQKADQEQAKKDQRARGIERLAKEKARMNLEEQEDELNFSKEAPLESSASDDADGEYKASSDDEDDEDDDEMVEEDVEVDARKAPRKVSV